MARRRRFSRLNAGTNSISAPASSRLAPSRPALRALTLSAAATPLVLTAPCDSPRLPLDLASRMHDALLSTNANVVIARAGERLHPVFCLCRRSLLGALEAYLASGSRKVAGWCAEMGTIEVDFSDQCEAFGNFNTLDDLANS